MDNGVHYVAAWLGCAKVGSSYTDTLFRETAFTSENGLWLKNEKIAIMNFQGEQ